MTPADLDDLHSCAAGQAEGVADGGKDDKAPVLAITAGQDVTRDRNTGEGADGDRYISVKGILDITPAQNGETHPKLTMV